MSKMLESLMRNIRGISFFVELTGKARIIFIAGVVLFGCSPSTLYAQTTIEPLTPEDRIRLFRPFYDADSTDENVCTTTSSVSSGGTNTNVDYAGRAILTEAQLGAIELNRPFYERAAIAVDIPWQMIAVIHLRETGLERVNPSNGQGIYQFYDQRGGPYPTGPVSDSEFQRQTDLVADFIKGKAGANYPENQQLTAGAIPDVIKDTFFSYNGRATVYEKQAEGLGFGPNKGFEGSPYVMNIADAQRDPEVNQTTWGQIKRDNGPIEYPANGDYGAFVTYAALAGISVGSCGPGSGTFVWPEVVPSTLTSCYGPRTLNGVTKQHQGIDISAGEGSPIFAVAAGTVTFAGDLAGYGPYFVVIKHTNGYGSSYGHMSSKSVNLGDVVTQGQQIGTEGNEGNSFGSHLHFNLFPGEYQGSDAANVNPLQNGLSVPAGVPNPNNCQ